MPQRGLDSFTDRAFRKRLLRWFDREKRSLPWRGETDPYRILVSEIMLQQTRVAVVKERYSIFLHQFPSVSRLARAAEESVLAAWSGLGYYRRARALHAAARQIHQTGAFPGTAAGLNELPGIGRYTAAAVASIAFGEPVAVVDGNVERVLQRLAGKKLSYNACWERAQELLEPRRPGDFNQALMELGATICLPGQPLCPGCPVVRFCSSSTPAGKRLPDASTGSIPRRRKAVLSYVLAQKDGAILLQQRPANVSLMPGMWELPQTKLDGRKNPVLKVRHSITTTDYTVFVYTARKDERVPGSWMALKKVNCLPLTGLARKILSRLELL